MRNLLLTFFTSILGLFDASAQGPWTLRTIMKFGRVQVLQQT